MAFSKRSSANSKDAGTPSRPKVTALKVRARYQAAVAELGLQALARDDLSTLFDDAVKLVAHILNI